jgi:hypothetical protein
MFSMVASLIFPSFLSIFQDFVLESRFKVIRIEATRHLEAAIGMETPVGDDCVQGGGKIQKVAVGLHRYAGAGNRVIKQIYSTTVMIKG